MHRFALSTGLPGRPLVVSPAPPRAAPTDRTPLAGRVIPSALRSRPSRGSVWFDWGYGVARPKAGQRLRPDQARAPTADSAHPERLRPRPGPRAALLRPSALRWSDRLGKGVPAPRGEGPPPRPARAAQPRLIPRAAILSAGLPTSFANKEWRREGCMV